MNNLLKKVLTVALSTAMLLSTLTFGGANVALAAGYVETEIKATETYNDTVAITEATLSEVNGVYTVSTEADWTALVYKASDYAGKTVVLNADITFTAANTTLPTFAGKLDGNGHTLKGVTRPLIASLNGGATIQNLIIDGANVTANTAHAGIIANDVIVTGDIALTNVAVKNSTITNVSVASGTDVCAGGMIGYMPSGDEFTLAFTNCTVSGSIIGKQYSGGLIGATMSGKGAVTMTMNNCKNSAALGAKDDTPAFNIYLGGMAGYIGKQLTTNVTNCANEGNATVAAGKLTTSQDIYAAGLIGRNRGVVNMQDCTNTGAMSVKATNVRNAYIGGLLGHTDTGAASFTSCVNYGDLENAEGSTAKEYVGGIVGYVSVATTVTACVNYGDLSANNSSYNATNTPYSGCVGGIAGLSTTATLKVNSSYNMGDVYSKDAWAGGIVGQAYRVVELTGCVNVGNVYSCVNPETMEYQTVGTVQVPSAGGILGGAIHANAKNSFVKNCTNVGKVVSAVNAGGMVGYIKLDTITGVTVSGCSNSGAILSAGSTGGIIGDTVVAVSVSDCVATGNYVGTGANLGAIAGNAANVTVENCTASVKLNDAYTAWEGAAVSTKTEADMLAEMAVLNLEAQKGAVTEGKFDVVVLAGMNKLNKITKVGFEVVRVVDGTVATLSTEGTKVYTDVYGYDESGAKKTVNATDYANVSYLSALKITNVSTDENVTYLYRAFAVKTVDGVETTVYGTWSAATFDAVA